MTAARRPPPILLPLAIAGFAIAALLLIVTNLAALVPPALWPDALLTPDPADTVQVLAHYAFLPRVSVALLAGGGLALAGAMLQYVLRNPLAEPATLGISAGAQLALTIATLQAPWAFGIGVRGRGAAGCRPRLLPGAGAVCRARALARFGHACRADRQPVLRHGRSGGHAVQP